MFLFPYVLKQAKGNEEYNLGQMFGNEKFAALGPITWALMVNIKNDVILISL